MKNTQVTTTKYRVLLEKLKLTVGKLWGYVRKHPCLLLNFVSTLVEYFLL